MDRCPICWDDLIPESTDIRTLSCTHQFHKKCIENWFAQQETCPNCRKDVSAEVFEGSEESRDRLLIKKIAQDLIDLFDDESFRVVDNFILKYLLKFSIMRYIVVFILTLIACVILVQCYSRYERTHPRIRSA